jgi:hypothetical protein
MSLSIGIGIGVERYQNRGGGVDPNADAIAHYNRVIADGGVVTYGLSGVISAFNSMKSFYGVTTITDKLVAFRWPDYLGYKVGSGTGVTAGRAVTKIYSACGASGDYVQTNTANQPALAAWSVGQNFAACFADVNGGFRTGLISNPNNTKLTVKVRIRKFSSTNTGTANFGQLIGHRNTATRNWGLYMSGSGSDYVPAMRLNDASNFSATASLASSFDGWLQVIVTTSGSDLILNFSTSSDNITYTALGSPVTATGKAGQIGSASMTFSVFSSTNVSNSGLACEMLKAEVYNSLDALIVNFDPNNYSRSASQTSWTAATTGETWTLFSSPDATGLKTMIVDQTMIQGNGTSHGMQAATLAFNSSTFTMYDVWRKYFNVTTAGSNGLLSEVGASVAAGQGIAFNPNDPANCESLYTNSNVGLNGTSWLSDSILLKVSTFEGDINGSPYEQGLRTNNTANTFNAVQASGANTAAIVATGQSLFARGNAASLWINAVYVADALTNQTDTSGQKASMYNLLADNSNII